MPVGTLDPGRSAGDTRRRTAVDPALRLDPTPLWCPYHYWSRRMASSDWIYGPVLGWPARVYAVRTRSLLLQLEQPYIRFRFDPPVRDGGIRPAEPVFPRAPKFGALDRDRPGLAGFDI